MKRYFIDLYVASYGLAHKKNPGSEVIYATSICMFNLGLIIINILLALQSLIGESVHLLPRSQIVWIISVLLFWFASRSIFEKSLISRAPFNSSSWLSSRNHEISVMRKVSFILLTIGNIALAVVLAEVSYLAHHKH